MTAESFASPRLLAAARAAAPFLAAIPRVPQIGVARRPADKGVIRLFVPRTPRERRMLQAAEYFVSRHPQCTRAERVRFGRAHGYAAAEFARAVRAARANLQQGSSARPEQRIHRPCVAGSNPAPAPFGSLPIAKANERRGGACENTPLVRSRRVWFGKTHRRLRTHFCAGSVRKVAETMFGVSRPMPAPARLLHPSANEILHPRQ